MHNVDKLGIIVGILLIVALLAYPHALYASEQQCEITIKEKWTEQHDNLVSDIDGNVYCIEDSVVFFKQDASNRYASLDEGETYLVTIVGWRVPTLSMYRNIIEIKEV